MIGYLFAQQWRSKNKLVLVLPGVPFSAGGVFCWNLFPAKIIIQFLNTTHMENTNLLKTRCMKTNRKKINHKEPLIYGIFTVPNLAIMLPKLLGILQCVLDGLSIHISNRFVWMFCQHNAFPRFVAIKITVALDDYDYEGKISLCFILVKYRFSQVLFAY